MWKPGYCGPANGAMPSKLTQAGFGNWMLPDRRDATLVSVLWWKAQDQASICSIFTVLGKLIE